MNKLVIVSIVYRGRRFITMMNGVTKNGKTQVNADDFDRWIAQCGVKEGTTYSF